MIRCDLCFLTSSYRSLRRLRDTQSRAEPICIVHPPLPLLSVQALIETNKDQARTILVANPTLTKGLLQVSNSIFPGTYVTISLRSTDEHPMRVSRVLGHYACESISVCRQLLESPVTPRHRQNVLVLFSFKALTCA